MHPAALDRTPQNPGQIRYGRRREGHPAHAHHVAYGLHGAVGQYPAARPRPITITRCASASISSR
ncbi:hypothetical protein [Nonomuraea basaltis]|uniref:hypothetical protein n=1 Tax=Nonomuraea basaltis TaxID=2495887 RepID=UPI001F0E76B8|nr:hypothetical protein [Nonomuraea basaltis]